MTRIVEQEPVEFAVVVPLPLLRELAAHEQQLLARMRPHEAEIGAQIGEFLPVVARHPAEQRTFPVHHLVMRQRQDELLGEGIDQAEGDVVVMPASVDRVLVHVAQGVVHPAHVPLVGEAEAALVRCARHARPRGAFLGDQHGAGAAVANDAAEFLQESDRLQVLAPAVAVGHPLALAAAVVAVEHRGDGIHAQPVDVVALQPVQRAADQEAAHLGAAEIVEQRVPVGLVALARVGMLVERGAVEARQAVRVGRKMRRHPVENHADAGFVEAVDMAAKLSGGPRRAVGANWPSG